MTKLNKDTCFTTIDRSVVRKITFLNNNTQIQDNNIVVERNDDKTEITISTNEERFQVPEDFSRFFEGFTVLEMIENIDLLDTSNVTDMSYLFYHCKSLKELDLSSWDTSNVTSFRGTFCCGDNHLGNAALAKLNISNWNVSKATDMSYMFYGCGRLKHIDTRNWNTENVKNFRHTFADCFSLKRIDTKNWNTKSVITFDGIFNDCKSLRRINLSNWDTSNCQEFDQMFDSCSKLQRIIGLKNINTNNGISFEEMFYGCINIRELNIPNIDTTKADGHAFTAFDSKIESTANTYKIIDGCNKLRKLSFSNNFVLSSYDKNKPHTILKKLDENGFVVVSPKTSSMYPLFKPNKDQVVFKKNIEPRRNDIVLFIDPKQNELIMHRVKRVFDKGFITRGDRSELCEYVPKENIFAVATELFLDNKNVKYRTLKYKYYYLYSVGYNWLAKKYHTAKRRLRSIL